MDSVAVPWIGAQVFVGEVLQWIAGGFVGAKSGQGRAGTVGNLTDTFGGQLDAVVRNPVVLCPVVRVVR